jgi:hypothetical protein
MRIYSRLVLSLALGLSGCHAPKTQAPTFATSDMPSWHGVWRGTIGTAPVEVCLQHDDVETFGAYYYTRHLQFITLGRLDRAAGKDAVTWTEHADINQTADGPLWRITSVKNGRLDGVWTDKGKSLPITLAAVTVEKDSTDQPCGSLAFNLPRLTKPVVTSQPAVLGGIAYTKVIFDLGKQFPDSGFETFQLTGDTPAIRDVNSELYKGAPADPQNATYFQCSMDAMANGLPGGSHASELRPETLTPGFMVVADTESEFCGGVHGEYGVDYSTWDLRRGAVIDLFTDFTAAGVTRTVHDKGTKYEYTTDALTPPLRLIVTGAYPHRDDDCDQVVPKLDPDAWQVRLTPQGMAFTPIVSHADQGCAEDDAVVPFDKLQPYLTDDGKALVAAFQAEIAARK